MSDLNEFARSVVRIPVAGPAPNNTLVYVRAQFPSTTRGITGRIIREQLFTVTLYQIVGFDQSRAHEYMNNTRISVTGWLNLARTVGPQEFLFAIDEIWGGLTPDGHVSITANIASQATDFYTVHDYWLSAYILTQEPEHDFSRPPIDWSAMKTQSLIDRSVSHKKRVMDKDEAIITDSPFSDL